MSEEQIEETETLLAIYGDDMEMKSTTPYRFKIKLSVPPTDEDEDNDSKHYIFFLNFFLLKTWSSDCCYGCYIPQ